MTAQLPFRQQNWASTPPVLPSTSSRWEALFGSDVLLLGGAIGLGILLPEAFHHTIANMTGAFLPVVHGFVEATLLGSLIAVIVGHVSFSRVTNFPQINPKTYILPSFMATYAFVIPAIYLTTSDFGLYHFVSSFIIVVAWYFAIVHVRERLSVKRIALVGEENHPLKTVAKNYEWISLSLPLLDDPVSAIVVSASTELTAEWEHFIAQAVVKGIPVHDERHMWETLSGRVELQHLMENSFGSLIPSLIYVPFKRLVDLVTACFALIFALPVILFFGLLVRCESPGPSLFRQQRMGFRGEPFTCYKLRSMRVGHNGPHFTAEDDDRITRVGRFIRKWHIDELPQIFNILKGDMSWIGPRPEAMELADLYENAIPFFAYRHAVRPGITGWAAVYQGNVGDIPAASVKLSHDFFYIKYCSIWLDGVIVLKTIRAVLTGFGAR